MLLAENFFKMIYLPHIHNILLLTHQHIFLTEEIIYTRGTLRFIRIFQLAKIASLYLDLLRLMKG